MTETRTKRLRRALDAPIDGASLGAFRLLLGSLLVVAVVRYWSKRGIHDAFLAPKWFFPYWGLEWVKPLPGSGMYAVYGAMGVLAVSLAFGWFSRTSAFALFVLFTYAHLCDATNYLNHYYLVSLLLVLMTVLPMGADLSLDAWRRRDRVPTSAWVVWLLRAQVGCVYFFGGVAKLKSDWLFHALPLRIWLATAGDFPLFGPLLRQPATAYVMSWTGALFDLSTPVLLSFRRTRPYAFALVVFFHLVTARLFQIGMFPWFMMASATIFFEPDWPRRLLARIAPRFGAAQSPPRPSPTTKAIRFAAAAWLALQLLLPLRQRLYAGNVLWTEEGYRFSWSVMLVEKTGSADFTVKDPSTGRTRQLRARDRLTQLQTKMMATSPEMILSFAHQVADEAVKNGEPRPQVFADVVVVLNGRAPHRLVDPNVDLAAEPEGLAPKRWLLPPPL